MKAQNRSNKDPSSLRCEDWMALELITAGPLDSVGQARELLEKHRINQLPIIEDDGKLAGILDAVADHDEQLAHAGVIAKVLLPAHTRDGLASTG